MFGRHLMIEHALDLCASGLHMLSRHSMIERDSGRCACVDGASDGLTRLCILVQP